MFKENLVLLRNLHGFSQEEIAAKVNISRQAYAKWESGATVPDIEKCSLLAEVYGVTIDSLMKGDNADVRAELKPAPRGKNIWGTITINDRGQLVIPKAAREKFGLVGGERLVVLSDEEGIALIEAKKFEANLQKMKELALSAIGKE